MRKYSMLYWRIMQNRALLKAASSSEQVERWLKVANFCTYRSLKKEDRK